MTESQDSAVYRNKDIYEKYRSEEVRQVLLASGFDSDSIERFGNANTLDNIGLELKILDAGEEFKEKGLGNFSTNLLVMLLFHNSWVPGKTRGFKSRVMRGVKLMFGEEAKYKSSRFLMQIPAIQILRETTGNYSGNLYEAREYWHGFTPSDSDFRNSVRIPTPLPNVQGMCLSEEASFVLGAIYAAGFLAKNPKMSDPCRLFIRGDKKDCHFFEEELSLLVSSVFNVSGSYTCEERPTRDRKRTYGLPTIKVDSMAISTWLRYDLGFPAEKTRNEGKQFPKICLGEHSYIPFLRGFVSLKGTKHKKGCIRFISRDTSLLLQLSEQLQRPSIPVSRVYDSASPFVEVVKSDVPKLLSKLNIRNPKLLE